MEINLFQRLLLREFDRLTTDLGIVLPLRGINNKVNKEIRVGSLSPLIERGKIRFRQGHSDQDLLVEQLLGFPDLPHDDAPDALEGALRIVQNLTMKAAGSAEIVPFKNYLENRASMLKRNKLWAIQ
jgi:predicted phage terminase large subunit-like protein